MSFQDFGKKGAGRPRHRNGNNSFTSGVGISVAAQGEGSSGTGQDEYASVSQTILQYQVCGYFIMPMTILIIAVPHLINRFSFLPLRL
jgi:hypothetical protein